MARIQNSVYMWGCMPIWTKVSWILGISSGIGRPTRGGLNRQLNAFGIIEIETFAVYYLNQNSFRNHQNKITFYFNSNSKYAIQIGTIFLFELLRGVRLKQSLREIFCSTHHVLLWRNFFVVVDPPKQSWLFSYFQWCPHSNLQLHNFVHYQIDWIIYEDCTWNLQDFCSCNIRNL